MVVLVKDIANMVRTAQEEGDIRHDADPMQTAWMIISRAWTDDIAHLMGVANEWGESRSNRMLDVILDSVAAKPRAVPTFWPAPRPPPTPARLRRRPQSCDRRRVCYARARLHGLND
jgi:hypothetical protein